VAVIVFVALAGGGYLLKSRGSQVPAAAADFVKGEGIPYTSADGTYTAQMPEAPDIVQQPITVQGVTVNMSAAVLQRDDYQMATASILLPVDVEHSNLDDVLDSALDGGLSVVSGERFRAERTTRGGLPALDASIKGPDGYRARVLVMASNNKMYVLFALAKTGTDKLFDALDESFVVTGT
jgi:hypothetical protein